jgi:pyruvate/2-oxoglutarate dehydrogenase complex dihydrolipoamide dehydrogenase (E3) component
MPEIPGLAAAQPMTHVEALELDRSPEHVIVPGGGYVGVELAQALRRFGSAVTVIEHGRQIAGKEDPDVAQALLENFTSEGIEVLLETKVREVEGLSGKQIRNRAENHHGEQTIEATDLLVAAGRTPNTRGIGLEAAGVELDARGYIKVNERLETTAPGVEASEMMAAVQTAMLGGLPYTVLRDAIFTHPTATEGLVFLLSSVPAKAIQESA